MKYDVDYFIEKFKATPARLWCVKSYKDAHDRCCALGHCFDGSGTIEREALVRLFHIHGADVVSTNDDELCARNLGQDRKTPRGRVLAALRWIKRQQPSRRE